MTRRNVTDEQYGQLVRRTSELVRRVDEGTVPFDETMNGLQMLIEESTKRQTFKVLVDYVKSLREMIQVGKYDWVNDDITSDHLPITGSGQEEKEITFFHFNRRISSDGTIAEMEKAGYRPALVEELLALGAAEKELQKQFPINALGSVWQSPRGYRRVPYLVWAGGGRILSLAWFGGAWDGRWRFAAVRK